MIVTTRNIDVNLHKGPRRLKQTTTKKVDASIRVKQPKNPQKPVSLSTAELPDVQDIKDKKKRDDIMEQRKLYLKDQKMVKINEKKKTKVGIGPVAFKRGNAVYDEKGDLVIMEKAGKTIEEFAEQAGAELIISKEKEEKKPWKDMTEEERHVAMTEQVEMTDEEKKKIAMKERMAKVRAARKKK